MDISIDEEHMKKVAKELGIEISFGNPPEKCGVFNTTTLELLTCNEVEEIISLIGEPIED